MHPLHQPFQRLSESQSRSAFIGEMPQLTQPIQIIDYQSNWSDLFHQEAKYIRQILGSTILALDHIGSTAVPGLAAKPIIDIDLSVADSADERSYLPLLEAAGYQLIIREPDWQQHRMLKGPGTDINLHVWTLGSIEAQRHLLFRDWLRANADDRLRYSQLKKMLANQDFKYMSEYNDAKSALIHEIYDRAFAAMSS